jgi:hypothetical protein
MMEMSLDAPSAIFRLEANMAYNFRYRAPELLLGCTDYGFEVDQWAIGRGLHLPTSQLNLSVFGHISPRPPV